MSIGSSPEPEKIIKKKNDNIKKSENNSKKKKTTHLTVISTKVIPYLHTDNNSAR